MLGCPLEYTDGKVLGSDEGITLGYTDGKVLGTIFGNVYGITLGVKIETEIVSFFNPLMVLMMESLRAY